LPASIWLIQARETDATSRTVDRAVVLEPLPSGRAPDSDKIFFAADPVRTGRKQAPEPYVAARSGLIEQQERRDLRAASPVGVGALERPAQQQVPFLGSLVQLPAW
jgi:hypothetical protein